MNTIKTSKKKALIIGGGIAGPVVAMFFRRAGIEPEIYEAQAAPDDFAGLFLTVASNGMGVLKSLGLETRVAAEGIPTSRLVMWNSSGKRLGEVPIGAAPGQNVASVTVKRGTLHCILREGAVCQGIKFEFGKQLNDITVTGEQQVVARFADGTTAIGDLLVGCDGLHSHTRRLIDEHAPEPTYTGLVGGGGFAQTLMLQPTPDTMHMIYGKQAFFGYVVNPSGEIYWFENHAYPGEPRRSELEAISRAAWQQKLLSLHTGDQPFIQEIIRASGDDIGMYPIYDIPALPTWHKGPVVLAGDAAHATSPNAGQGASLALEDAMVLAKCVRDMPELGDAFTMYEQLRRERVEKIVQFSRERGQNKAVSNPVARWFRDLILPFFLKRLATADSMAWIYDYQIDWNSKQEVENF